MPIELLPEKLKGPVRRLRKLMLTDSGVLVILGVFFLARGIGYLAGSGAPGIPAQLLPFPGWAWAIVWCVTGLVAVCCAKWWSSPLRVRHCTSWPPRWGCGARHSSSFPRLRSLTVGAGF